MSYTGAEKIADIENHGWTDVPFFLSETNRAAFAALANTVIGVAMEDDGVRQALDFKLDAAPAAQARTGTFGLLLGGRHSDDAKIALHVGYQSRERANAVLGMNQPRVMKDFWEATDMMLSEVEKSAKSTLRILGAEAVIGTVLPAKPQRRNVQLRTVRYPGATDQPIGKEVVSGHADIGLATFHLYETHGGWMKAAPYPTELMIAGDSPERRLAVRGMRELLSPILAAPHKIPFLLGANWQGSATVPEGLRNLPACYHAGFVPEIGAETVSPFAEQVVGSSDDRVSVVAFLHANSVALAKGTYTPAPVEYCRPRY